MPKTVEIPGVEALLGSGGNAVVILKPVPHRKVIETPDTQGDERNGRRKQPHRFGCGTTVHVRNGRGGGFFEHRGGGLVRAVTA